MGSQAAGRGGFTQWVRWTARIRSIASTGLFLLFIIGEGIHTTRPTEWQGFLFFPFGISFGMLLTWRGEGMGGSVTVGSQLISYGIHYGRSAHFRKAGHFWRAPVFSFLLSWFLLRKATTTAIWSAL